MVSGTSSISYDCLLQKIEERYSELCAFGRLVPGSVVALTGDFDFSTVISLFALIKLECIIVPFWRNLREKNGTLAELAGIDAEVVCGENGITVVETSRPSVKHPLYLELLRLRQPGLVLFSSGSTGTPKGIVHNLQPILDKFVTRRPPAVTLGFLLFDHIGGLNTLFHTLFNGGCFITLPDRRPETVLAAIEQHQAQILPTSPSFLSLLLISGLMGKRSLKSLRLITYGTEPMPQYTLQAIHAALPEIKLQQTYGMSELGILSSKSENSESLWVRIGGRGFETRVREGILQIKAASSMLGYLNAPSPFTADGWFITGDLVEQRGEFFRFLGRNSEVIIVGGEKVFPLEIENVLLEMKNISQAAVYGVPNALLGQVVCADLVLLEPEDRQTLKKRVRLECLARLAPFKVPVKLKVVPAGLISERFKKIRAAEGR